MAVLKKLDKKERKLSTFFLRFLLEAVLSVMLTGIVWMILILLGVGLHITLPANYVEQEVRDFANSLNMQTSISPDMIPDGTDYAIYYKDGLLQETNLPDSYLEKADSVAVSEQDLHLADISGRVYQRLETDSQILVLTYRIRSVFANPTMRCVFPDIETVGLIVFFLLLILNLTFVIKQNS